MYSSDSTFQPHVHQVGCFHRHVNENRVDVGRDVTIEAPALITMQITANFNGLFNHQQQQGAEKLHHNEHRHI